MNNSREERSILTLHLVPDIGPRRFQNLIARFGTAADALEASTAERLVPP